MREMSAKCRAGPLVPDTVITAAVGLLASAAAAADGCKATSGTRTPDLRFTKAPLYQLS